MFKKSIVVMLILCMVFTILPVSNMYAAGSYSASLGSSSINVGASTSVNISTSNAAGQFNVSSSNPQVAALTNSTTWVDGRMENAIAVNGISQGTATITITPTNVSDDEYNMITASRQITVTVNTPTSTPTTNTSTENNALKRVNNNETAKKTDDKETKSSNNNLKSITLKSGTIEFNKDVTKYTVNVDKTVTSLGVEALAEDEKATVKIDGDSNFKTGENKVTITVTAEDGSVKVYEILVIKSKLGAGPLISLKVVGYEISPSFDPAKHKYTLTVSKTDKLDIEYELKDKDSTVEIKGNDKLKTGKNVITVTVTEKDGTKTEYKITVTVADDVVSKSNSIWITIIGILGVVIVAETTYIVIKKRKEK